MSYRGPQPKRISTQIDADIFRHAGNTATWRQYVSASANVSVAGLGSALSYREQLITGIFGFNVLPRFMEHQSPGGLIAAGDVWCTTREKPARKDELRWRGQTYRVDSDPVPSKLDGCWVSVLKRGNG